MSTDFIALLPRRKMILNTPVCSITTSAESSPAVNAVSSNVDVAVSYAFHPRAERHSHTAGDFCTSVSEGSKDAAAAAAAAAAAGAAAAASPSAAAPSISIASSPRTSPPAPALDDDVSACALALASTFASVSARARSASIAAAAAVLTAAVAAIALSITDMNDDGSTRTSKFARSTESGLNAASTLCSHDATRTVSSIVSRTVESVRDENGEM